MYVRFTRAFDWTPPTLRRITMAYKQGYVGSVTHDCAAAAIAAGAAEEIDPPPKEDREPLQVRGRARRRPT